jgi:flagellar motor switch protein FliN
MNDEELEKEDLTTDTNDSSEQENVQDETESSDEIDSNNKESSQDDTLIESDSETEKVEFYEFDSEKATKENAQNNIEILKDVNVEVSVELGRITMPLGDVLNLSKGSVVELENLAGEQINVLVNGQKIATGEVVVIGEHFGVRISKLISTKLKTN